MLFWQEDYQNDESLTDEKLRTLGTDDAVDRSRRLALNRSNIEIQSKYYGVTARMVFAFHI